MNFPQTQKFARLGFLPKEIGKVRPEKFPVCSCYQFGKQKKTSPSTSATTHQYVIESSECPGDIISVDMMHSPVGGMIPVSKVRILNDKYNIA